MAFYEVMPSPVGDIFVGGSARGLHRIDFIAGARDAALSAARLAAEVREPVMRAPALAGEAVEALRAYFEGRNYTFALPLAPKGTAFQQAVWRALLAVRPGETASYLDIARAIGRPSAARAVGGAVGSNPLAVVVPCHRIVATGGGLGGYAGGLARKRWLLAHEAASRAAPDGVTLTAESAAVH
jgi:methylated-DNA-[protein]-cysteine S-methyltransferase